jgi:hypothetical protein
VPQVPNRQRHDSGNRPQLSPHLFGELGVDLEKLHDEHENMLQNRVCWTKGQAVKDDVPDHDAEHIPAAVALSK